jgi:prevent-host-death family protein
MPQARAKRNCHRGDNAIQIDNRTEFGLNLVHTKFGAHPMKHSRIKPISYLKANAAEILRGLAEGRDPLVITQNGEAKAIIQDIASYEETQETMALLKILALGNRQIEEGKVVPAADVIRRLRGKKPRK